MRVAGLLLLLSPLIAIAQSDETDARPLIEILGAERWEGLPPWRQEMIRARWRRFAEIPPERQEEIRKRGLAEFLIKPEHDFSTGRLPPRLKEFVNRLPEEVRERAGKLVIMRLRQHRLDRNLALLEPERRRPYFFRLFPEPFAPEQVRAASADLDAEIAKVMAARVRARLRAEEDQRGSPFEGTARIERASELVRAETRGEEERVTDRLLREMAPLSHPDPKEGRRFLEREGFFAFERLELIATPRQRELLRYALRPAECPILDLAFLGPEPEEPEARRLWEEDFRVFARLDLLAEAGFPREVILHLASSGSAEDFFRGVKALRGPRPPPPPGEPR